VAEPRQPSAAVAASTPFPAGTVVTSTPPGTEVVVMGPDDWQRARDLRLAALADAPDAFWATLDDERDDLELVWRARLGRDDATTLAVRLDDGGGRTADAALATVLPAHHQPQHAGLVSVWVAPRARGRGVGRALVHAAIVVARGRGFRRLVLDVGDHNTPAMALYTSLGFVPTGRRGAFPPPRDHITEHELALDLT
jgi:ribosomal protein S18 acetylase RimI-like enzyme